MVEQPVEMAVKLTAAEQDAVLMNYYNADSSGEAFECVERIITARIAALAAEVSEMAAIGQTGYGDLTDDQLQRFRVHPLGAAFGDVADIPEGRDAVIAWLSASPTSPTQDGA